MFKSIGHAIASTFSGLHSAVAFLTTYGAKILGSQEAVSALTSILSPKYKAVVQVGFAVLGDVLAELAKIDSSATSAESITVTFTADVVAMVKQVEADFKAELEQAKAAVTAVK
jgi:hypothetical protein